MQLPDRRLVVQSDDQSTANGPEERIRCDRTQDLDAIGLPSGGAMALATPFDGEMDEQRDAVLEHCLELRVGDGPILVALDGRGVEFIAEAAVRVVVGRITPRVPFQSDPRGARSFVPV